jgi:hypothetical protein
MWSNLRPLAIAEGFAIFGLVMFECGQWRKELVLRLQGYALLAAAFVRIFALNLTATGLQGQRIGPAIYTVAPIILIDFYIWARLQRHSDPTEASWIGNAVAWFGTVSIAALIYFQANPEWIVTAWAALAVLLLLAVLVMNKEIFLQQAAAAIVAVVARGVAYNIYGDAYFTSSGWHGKYAVLAMAAALLLASLPIALRLSARYTERPLLFEASKMLGLHRMEQWVFFAPVTIVTLLIMVKMNPGMVTLSWGLEGVAVVLLGLSVTQRSYRITGLLLLLLCVCKIVFHDAWQLTERDRYITFITLGAALMLVSTLYNRYRESVRRLL